MRGSDWTVFSRSTPVVVGPTLYAKLSENLSISAAFSTQIAGKSQAAPGRSLDLDNFSGIRPS